MEMWRQRRQASLQTDAAGVEKLALGAGGDGQKDLDRDRERDRDLDRGGSGPIPISIGSAGATMTGSPAAWPSPSTSISISAAGSDAGHSPDSTMSGIGLGPAYSGSFIAGYGFVDRTLDVLIAEDNPISQKILETLLTRMGCRCVCVEDGPQALAATMGSIRESPLLATRRFRRRGHEVLPEVKEFMCGRRKAD
jgi:CheY-like chemotaxis protein